MTTTARSGARLVLALAIFGGALAQGATAAPPADTVTTAAAIPLAVVSAAILVGQVAAVSWAVRVLAGAQIARPPQTLLWWSAGAVVVGAATGILAPVAVPLVVAAAGWVLPAAADGRATAPAGAAVFVRRPVAAVAATVVTVVATVLLAVIALTAGLFVTGAYGGVLMWVAFGVVGASLLTWWTRLALSDPKGDSRG